ncbi:MAG: MaoC family dehydratase [Chloroflexi bacterium]|nr:MaoC family dehydratase [Chloroflexota bacterium]
MIPEEVKQFIGRTDPPIIRHVENGSVRRYAEAVGNDNPLHYDEEYARNTKYGGIVAQPGFWGWPTKTPSSSTGLAEIVGELQAALARGGFPRILDGGISYDFFLPVRAGDIIVTSPKVTGLSEKEGKSGSMIICNFETSYVNQNGDLVAKSYQTFIAR